MICPKCGASYLGDTCPSCNAKCKIPVEIMCTQLVDKNGNHIDVNELAGAYESVHAIKTFLKKCTNYLGGEIDELARYIDSLDGNDYGFIEAASVKKRLEAAGTPAPSPEPARSSYSPQATAREPRVQPEKPLSKRERIKENKRNGIACCPKCGSASITANKKGYSFIKGGIGAGLGTMVPGVGAIIGLGAGNLGSKKLVVTCLNCGHKWKI